MDAKQIGEVIRQARKRKKITQQELGARIGLAGDAKTAISAYEKGTTKVIPFARRAKLANILNIPLGQLLYDNEEFACVGNFVCADEPNEQEKLIKAVNAELEKWLCSGDTDYLHKAMAIIRAEIDNEE